MNQRSTKYPTRLAELVLDRPTLSRIAREAGVSRSYVSAIAAGHRPPSGKVKAAAVRVLKLDVEEIFPEKAPRP